jgi:hypothetical protein
VANTNSPFGLRPVGTLGNASYSGKIQKFFSSTSETAAIGMGDPVALAGSADADGIPTVIRMTTGGTAVGVVVGAVPDPTDLTTNFKKANTARYLLVDTDPNTVYEIQSNYDGTNASTQAAAADVGTNWTIAMGTVDTTTGNGKTVMGTTKGTNTTYDLQLLRLSPGVDNEIGQYAKWLVRLNLNQYKANATGV